LLGVSRQSKADCQSYEGNYQAFFHYLLQRGACRTEICRGISHVARNIRVADGGKNSPFGQGSLGEKTLDPFSRSKSIKELPVPYWPRVVSHRGIDLLNRALEKYRLGQSEPIFVGGKLRGIPSPKSERAGRAWNPTAALLTACNVLAFLQRSPSTEPCFLSVTNQRTQGLQLFF
jgi:hypothetical protein